MEQPPVIESIDLSGLVPDRFDETFEASKLPELNARLKEIRDTSKDYVMSIGHMVSYGSDTDYKISFIPPGSQERKILKPTPWFEQQMCTKLGIPTRYMDHMKEAKLYDLAADNINQWTAHESPKKVMVRTVGENARALLSDRYQVIDSYDVTMGVLSTVMDINMGRDRKDRVQFSEANLTETKLYLRMLDYSRPYDIKGDVHYPGIVVGNSDYGDGALFVKIMLWRMVCANGMMREAELRKVHVGTKIEEGMYSAETRSADSKVWMIKIRDVLKFVLENNTPFDTWKKEIEGTADTQINAPDTIKEMTKAKVISEDEGDAIIKAMMGDVTAAPGSEYHLLQGMTALAKTMPTDRRVELEELAGNPAQLTPMLVTA